jgi:hypothetical protein
MASTAPAAARAVRLLEEGLDECMDKAPSFKTSEIILGRGQPKGHAGRRLRPPFPRRMEIALLFGLACVSP